jgi:hypothetical protein
MKALKKWLSDAIVFEEFRVESGYGYVSEKRIDLFQINPIPSDRNARTAYEIKISRNDFTRELNKPLKRWAGMLFTNRFYFVAPKGMIKIKEVPDECGLIEVDEEGTVTVKIKAPWRESMSPTWPFVGSLVRRAVKEGEVDTG